VFLQFLMKKSFKIIEEYAYLLAVSLTTFFGKNKTFTRVHVNFMRKLTILVIA